MIQPRVLTPSNLIIGLCIGLLILFSVPNPCLNLWMESFNCEGGNAMLCTPTPASQQLPAPACKLGKMPNKAGASTRLLYLDQMGKLPNWLQWIWNRFFNSHFRTKGWDERNFDNGNRNRSQRIFFQNLLEMHQGKKSFSRQISLQGTHKSLLIHEQDFWDFLNPTTESK